MSTKNNPPGVAASSPRKLAAAEKRSKDVCIALTPAEFSEMRRAATRLKIPISTHVRNLALRGFNLPGSEPGPR